MLPTPGLFTLLFEWKDVGCCAVDIMVGLELDVGVVTRPGSLDIELRPEVVELSEIV